MLISDKSKIASVYSGKAGKCCCGCSGKHYYAEAVKGDGKAIRGYEIDADEISDKMITKVVNILNTTQGAKEEDSYFFVNVGNRDYVAYKR